MFFFRGGKILYFFKSFWGGAILAERSNKLRVSHLPPPPVTKSSSYSTEIAALFRETEYGWGNPACYKVNPLTFNDLTAERQYGEGAW